MLQRILSNTRCSSSIIVLFLGFLLAPFLYGAESGGKKTSSGEKTVISPEVTYRQAYLQKNEDSVFHHANTDEDYVDQIYLSLKFLKTFHLLDEVLLEPVIRTKRNNPGVVEINIDQAYVRAVVENVQILGGKKTEFYGSGFFVNPSDLLNEDKDLFDPLYQKEGKVFTRLNWIGDGLDVGIGFIPKRASSAGEGRLWLISSLDLWETTLQLQYTYNRQDLGTLGFSAARFFGERFELHVDSRYQQHQRDSDVQPERSVFDCSAIETISQEAREAEGDELFCLEPTFEDADASAYTVVGTRVVLTSKRTVVLETIQNQSGLSNEEREMYYRYVRKKRDSNGEVTDPPTRVVGRQYVFLGFQDEESLKRTSIALSGLYNLGDSSLFSNVEFRYVFSPIVNASLVYSYLSGDAGSEFGEFPFSEATYLVLRGKF